MKNNNELSDKPHWQARFRNVLYEVKSSFYERYFKNYLPVDSSKTCIEIGVVPGNHLIYLAKFHKYRPVGLDYIDDIGFVGDNLIFNGISEFELIKEDFLKWNPEKKYDVVCSYGFVEHFDNYEEVIKKHMDIVKEGGYLVVSVPYIKYFQLLLRKIVYKEGHFEKLSSIHNPEIMNLKKLETIVTSDNIFTKLFCGYIREMTIWFNPDDSFIKTNRKCMLGVLKLFEKQVNKLGLSNKFISPEIMGIFQKKAVV